MKKALIRGLAALSATSLLSVGMCVPTYADTAAPSVAASNQTALSQSQILAIANKLLSIPDNFSQPNVSMQTNWLGQKRTVFIINWQSQQMQVSRVRGIDFINAIFDANTGQLLEYDTSSRSSWETSGPVGKEKALNAANSILEKYAPEEAGQVTLQSQMDMGANGYQFTFVRVVNQILAPFDSIHINLDATGKLVNYQMNWQDAKFLDTKPAISVDTATSKIKQALGLHLAYVQNYMPQVSTPQIVLAYIPTDTQAPVPYAYTEGVQPPWIDANTGDSIDPAGKPLPSDSSQPTSLTPIVPGGPAEWPTNKPKQLTAEDAEKLVRSELSLPDSYTLGNVNTQTQNSGNTSMTILQMQFLNSDSTQTISVGVDADNGVIQMYDAFQPYYNGTSPQTVSESDPDKAQQVATDFLKKVFPNLAGAIVVQPASVQKFAGPNPQPMTNLQFSVLHNGVPINGGNLTVNTLTGAVMNYYLSVNFHSTYPDASHVLSLDEATDLYLKENPVKLQYVLPVSSATNAPIKAPDAVTYSATAKLIYATQSSSAYPELLDAQTGTFISQGPVANGQVPNDIKGHYGENEMALLASSGILPVSDGQVHPDKVLTRAEFIGLLVKANGVQYGGGQTPLLPFADVSPTDPHYADIMQATLQGWLPAAKYLYPDKPITNIDAANWLVDFLGWQYIASKKGLFASSFKDAKSIPTSELGDAAIASSFNLIPLTKGNFVPGHKMTVADVSVAIVRALQLQTNLR